jgi:hypothetical protein
MLKNGSLPLDGTDLLREGPDLGVEADALPTPS